MRLTQEPHLLGTQTYEHMNKWCRQGKGRFVGTHRHNVTHIHGHRHKANKPVEWPAKQTALSSDVQCSYIWTQLGIIVKILRWLQLLKFLLHWWSWSCRWPCSWSWSWSWLMGWWQKVACISYVGQIQPGYPPSR